MTTILALAIGQVTMQSEYVFVWDSLDEGAKVVLKSFEKSDHRAVEKALKDGTLVSLSKFDRFEVVATDNLAQRKEYLDKIASMKALTKIASGSKELKSLDPSERGSVDKLIARSFSAGPDLSGNEKVGVTSTISVVLEANGKKIRLTMPNGKDGDRIHDLLSNPVDWDSVAKNEAKGATKTTGSPAPTTYSYSFAFEGSTTTSFSSRLDVMSKVMPDVSAYVQKTADEVKASAMELAGAVTPDELEAIKNQKLGAGPLNQQDPAWKKRLQDAFDHNATKLGFDGASKDAFWHDCKVTDASVNLYLSFGLKRSGQPAILNQFFLGKP